MTDTTNTPTPNLDTTPEAADARFAANGGDESVIPAGPYCYKGIELNEEETVDANGRLAIKVIPCPYWASDLTKPAQSYGYCARLKAGDWEEDGGVLHLWDMVKECGVNDDDEDLDEPEK